MKWFRLYHDLPHSQKWGELNDTQRSIYIELLCMASARSDDDDRGTIDTDGLAWRLRRNANQVQSACKVLAKAGLLEYPMSGEGGIVRVPQWDRMQRKADSSRARVRKHRESNESSTECNVTEALPKRYSNAPEQNRTEQTREEVSSPAETQALALSPKRPDAISPVDVFSLYQSICVPAGFVSHGSMNPTMKKQIKARSKERRPWEGDGGDARSDTLEWWRAFFASCATSTFLCENSNVGNLVYITGPKNMDKIIAANFWVEKKKTSGDAKTERTLAPLQRLAEKMQARGVLI